MPSLGMNIRTGPNMVSHDAIPMTRRPRRQTENLRTDQEASHPLSANNRSLNICSALSESNLNLNMALSHHSLYVMSQHAISPGIDSPGQEGGLRNFFKDIKENIKKISNFKLLKDIPFLLFAISNVFTSIGFNAPFLFLPHQAEMAGIDEQRAAFLISVIGIANTVGRVLFGFLGDLIGKRRMYLYCTALLISGISTVLSPLASNYSMMVVYAATYGLTVGTYVTLTAVLLVDLLGIENLVASFGLLLLFQGVATILGPPMLGWVFDATGSYYYSFVIAGVMIGISGLMLYIIPCIEPRLERRKLKKNREVTRGERPMENQSVHVITA